MNQLISIIIPVYNCENFVFICLNSIDKQTYQNFEVLIINDGSIDRTEEICRQFCATHKKFKLITKQNGGVSSARNEGLKWARGELVSFVDADDYVDPSFLEKMIFNENENDFSMCRIVLFDSQDKRQYLEEINLHNFVAEPSSLNYFVVNNIYDVQNNWIKTDAIFGSSCRILFRKKLIDKISLKFNESLPLGEDKIFVMRYMQEAKKGLLIDDYLYSYRINGNSATNQFCSGYNPNYLESTFLMYKSQIDFLKTTTDKAKNVLINYSSMKNSEGLVINELKLAETPTVKKLKFAFKKQEYKQYLKFSIREVKKSKKLTLKNYIYLFLIKFKHFHFLKLFFSKKRAK